MENFHSHGIFLSLLLFLLLQLSSLSSMSSSYTSPLQYFINCGSDSNTTVPGWMNRTFVADIRSGSISFSKSDSVDDANPSANTSPLYQSARVFTKTSRYELEIPQNGTHVLRLHFYPFSSPKRYLFDARFDVFASGFFLLSNFTVNASSNSSPVIKEFLVFVSSPKLRINFSPSQGSPFAFVNAIEAFLAPANLIPSAATTNVSSAGNYKDLRALLLHPIYRINVGGSILTPQNDSLWRNWVPDDDFLNDKDSAKSSDRYIDRPKYQEGGPNVYVAPDPVYVTAKEMNIHANNVTWTFGVSKSISYFVRVHFCDIISDKPNILWFKLYFGKFDLPIHPYDVYHQAKAPFYRDFVVDSDGSGFLNITIGPDNTSPMKTAFLNGLEIMEVLKLRSPLEDQSDEPARKDNRLFVIIGAVVGGVVLAFILVGVALFILKSKKPKAVGALDLQSVDAYGGNSYSRIAEGTSNVSSVDILNLGLKVPFAEILYATNNFSTKSVIGEGGFGKVYKGTLLNGSEVAVKRSEPGLDQGLPEFQTEILVLSRIRHRHLVSLIGYCDERSEMILVYEFMEKGTLRDHLYNLNEGSKSAPRSQLSWKQRLEICIGAAKGIHYLHTGSDGGIIHRDVKSTNILLDKSYVAKVADFGLSRSGPLDQTHVSTNLKGSFGYFDPEYFKWMQLTQKSDVYSFGVVLLEVLCARPAINSLLPRDQVNLAEWGLSWLKKGQLEKIIDPLLEHKIKPNSLQKFGETVDKCLKENSVDRPSMLDVIWDLEYALQLQQAPVPREPHEDSSTDATWELQLPGVSRLPSHSITIEEGEELPLATSVGLDSSSTYSGETEVFSQLKIDDDAR